jgi:hypothetical protein
VPDSAFTILVSEALVLEISSAPAVVQATFEAHRAHMEALETTAEAAALASVARADALVSWNFKHLVQLRRIRGFHAVNVLRGYPLIEIRSPLEVIDDEA